MRVIVTGGGGFLLSSVAKALKAVALDKHFDEVARAYLQDTECVVRDVTSPDAYDGLHPDVIIAGAAVTPTAAEELTKASDVARVNFVSVLHALEKAPKFVLVSSDAALVDNGSLYATTKIAAERAVRHLAPRLGVSAVIVRFSDVYGVMDRDTGARNRHNLPYFVKKKREIRVTQKGLLWDFIDADSVARFFVQLIHQDAFPAKGEAPLEFNIALGHTVTVDELASVTQYPVIYDQDGIEPLSPDHWLVKNGPIDIGPALALGWRPTPFATALTHYLRV